MALYGHFNFSYIAVKNNVFNKLNSTDNNKKSQLLSDLFRHFYARSSQKYFLPSLNELAKDFTYKVSREEKRVFRLEG